MPFIALIINLLVELAHLARNEFLRITALPQAHSRQPL